MNIAKIEPIAISLPMSKPVIMAGEAVRRADNVLVRLQADTGLVGWGEAASAPTMTGETSASMVAAVRHLSSALIGRAADDIGGALAAMDGRMYGNHGAKAAIEIALHDLAGRGRNRPAHALLGEVRRRRMTLLGVIGGGDLEGDLRDAAGKKGDGFSIFKIKVGVDTPATDAERTRRICDILRPHAVISADANQGFSTDEAIAFVRAVAGCGLDFLEQPVAADDLAGMAAVAAATDIAIGADEGIHCLADIRRHHEHKAARGVSLKAIKLGGLRALVEALASVRSPRHAGQRLLQDRGVEHRLRGRAARGGGHPRARLGADADQRRPHRRRDGASDPCRAWLCRYPRSSGTGNRRR